MYSIYRMYFVEFIATDAGLRDGVLCQIDNGWPNQLNLKTLAKSGVICIVITV